MAAKLSHRLPWHSSPSHIIKKSPTCNAFYGLQNRVSCCDLVFPEALKHRGSHPGNVTTTRSRTPSLSIPNTLAGSRYCRHRSQKTSHVKVLWVLFFPVTKGALYPSKFWKWQSALVVSCALLWLYLFYFYFLNHDSYVFTNGNIKFHSKMILWKLPFLATKNNQNTKPMLPLNQSSNKPECLEISLAT